MITRPVLRRIAKARLQDAEVLFRGRRYDGAIYLCGYAIEVQLKVRICTTLRWTGFPETSGEFQGYQSFKTHDFEDLLHMTARESSILGNHKADWSVVVQWRPESRYRPPGTAKRQGALLMLESTRRLMRAI